MVAASNFYIKIYFSIIYTTTMLYKKAIRMAASNLSNVLNISFCMYKHFL